MQAAFLLLASFTAVANSYPPSFTVSVFQPASFTLTPTKAQHMAGLHDALSNAAASGSSLLVCPELYNTGYNPTALFEGEPRGGPSYTAAGALAAQFNVSLLWTYAESAGGKLYDAAVLFNRSGAPLLDYRKVNLAPDGEARVFTAGDGMAPVVDLDGVRVGVMICYDTFLPEPARILALQAVDLVLVPTANGYPPGVFNQLAKLLVPARALENNAFVVYNNWFQPNASLAGLFSFYGQSVVSDPAGTLLFEGPSDRGTLTHVALSFSKRSPGNTAQKRPAGDTRGLCPVA
jgi:predicted amidohydrolase